MLLNKTGARENALSRFAHQVKQAFGNRKNSRFWFGPLLSAADEIQPNSINMDISKNQYTFLLNILTVLVSDMISFYPKTPPEQVYRLLHVTRSIYDLNIRPGEGQFQGYHLIMHKVHFYNGLGLFLIKYRQYSLAYQCYQFILQIVTNDIVDNCTDIFLASISNYLTFVRIHQYSHASRKIAELLNHLQGLYQKLLNRYIQVGCLQSSLILLLSVFKQHQIYLGSQFSAQNKLLIKKYEETQLHIRQVKEYNQINNDNVKFEQYLYKNKQYKSTDIQIKRKQLNFINPPTYLQNNLVNKQRLSLRFDQQRNHYVQPIQHPNANNNQQPDFLVIKAETRKSINHQQVANKTIEAPINRPQSKRRIISEVRQKQNEQKIQEKIKKNYFKDEPLVFKMNYSLIEVMNDGLILSDFLKQKKKFLNWHQVFFIIKKLRFSCLFKYNLPISCFYDIAKILSHYIYKGQNQKGVAISQTPKQLVEINMLTKIFWVEGPFVRIFMMNQYDISHIEMAIDCYLSQFQLFFKNVTKSEYIQRLNRKIFQQFLKQQQRQVKIYSLQYWKRKKQTSVQQLATQIKSQKLLDLFQLKLSLFKIILMLPNNKQILFCLKQKSLREPQKDIYMQIDIIALNQNQQIENILKIPMHRLMRYFPISSMETGPWMKKYGKLVVEGYLQTFQNFPFSFNNMQFFNVITYAKKIEMTRQGKYVTPVVAELIGSKTRIWGISIRFLDQNITKQLTTFIYNPYFELLAPVMQLSPEQRKNILISHLLEGRVATTYDKLVESKLAGSMLNLIDYWTLIDF